MDVRCEKCQTVYEFDDSKVTDAGVSVKCTQCGNLFKVRKRTITATSLGPKSTASGIPPVPQPPPVPPERQRTSTMPRGVPQTPPPVPRAPTPPRGVPAAASGAPDDRVWLVRVASSGEVKRFRELTTLQQWIVEKRVSRDDEISRSGDTWKRLGGIAELASFFHVVEQAESRAASGEDPALATTAPMPAPSAPPPTFSMPGPSAPIYNGGQHSPSSGQYVPGTGQFLPNRQTGSAFANTAAMGPMPDSPVDDDEIDEVPRGGMRTSTMLAVATLLVLLGVVGYLAAFRRDAVRGLFGGDERRGNEAYKKGREYLLQDSDDAFRLADQQLQRAHGADEANPPPIAALAEVNALWGGYLRDDAKRAENAKQPGRADELRKLAQAHLDDAKRYSNEAVTIAVDDPEVNRAMAAFLLVDGAPAAQVEGFLRRCEEKHPDDADAAYLHGALAFREGKLGEAKNRTEQANQLSQQKTQHDLLRADYLLAEIAVADKRKDEARSLAQKVIDANGHHDRARALLAELEAPPPAPDAGVTPAVTVAAVPGVPTAPPPPGPSAPPSPSPTLPPATAKSEKPAKSDGEEPRGFEALLSQGNRMLENGHGKEAQRLFEKALALQPGNVDALNGLGYCYLDTEHFVAAVDKFKEALRNKPASGDAIIGIAEAYKMRGDKPHALEYYKKYAAELPSGSKIRMAQTNIHEIESALAKAAVPTASEVREVPAPPPP